MRIQSTSQHIMYKLPLIGLALVLLSGCDASNVSVPIDKPDHLCIDGVTYIGFKAYYGQYAYLSVKLDRESKIVECDQSPH